MLFRNVSTCEGGDVWVSGNHVSVSVAGASEHVRSKLREIDRITVGRGIFMFSVSCFLTALSANAS